MAVHKHSYASLSLSQQGGPHRRKTNICPFIEEVTLPGLEEMVLRVGAASVLYAQSIPDADEKLLGYIGYVTDRLIDRFKK